MALGQTTSCFSVERDFNNFMTIIPTEKQNFIGIGNREFVNCDCLPTYLVYINDSKYECQSEIDFTLNI